MKQNEGMVDLVAGLLLVAYYALAVWLLMEELSLSIPLSTRAKYYAMRCCYGLASSLGARGMKFELQYLDAVGDR